MFRKSISFLGHTVTERGIHTERSKIAAIEGYPAPTNKSELRTFVGMCGWYRKFVRHFSKIAAPLTDLQKDAVPFCWGPEQQDAFEALKSALCSAPVLVAPDVTRPYVLSADASDYALGAVLMQDQGQGYQPCAFFSRKLKGAETRYAVHEKEMQIGRAHV